MYRAVVLRPDQPVLDDPEEALTVGIERALETRDPTTLASGTVQGEQRRCVYRVASGMFALVEDELPQTVAALIAVVDEQADGPLAWLTSPRSSPATVRSVGILMERAGHDGADDFEAQMEAFAAALCPS